MDRNGQGVPADVQGMSVCRGSRPSGAGRNHRQVEVRRALTVVTNQLTGRGHLGALSDLLARVEIPVPPYRHAQRSLPSIGRPLGERFRDRVPGCSGLCGPGPAAPALVWVPARVGERVRQPHRDRRVRDGIPNRQGDDVVVAVEPIPQEHLVGVAVEPDCVVQVPVRPP
jgi:hypothetical protein